MAFVFSAALRLCSTIPLSLPSIVTEGQSAMDGRLSFVEQGRDKFVWNKFKQLGWPAG
jgi:hypothetical protein